VVLDPGAAMMALLDEAKAVLPQIEAAYREDRPTRRSLTPCGRG
jgi:hypothetical protein